jgi:CRISPR type III-B/RAMP module-associated protein Cmr5
MHLDQKRAKAAFGYVQALSPAVKKDFLSLARSLPVMFQTNGLLATWAHLLAKKGQEYDKTLEALMQYFRQGDTNMETEAKAVFRQWTQLASLDLRQRTAEAIEYAVWLKRAAEALCDTGESTQ